MVKKKKNIPPPIKQQTEIRKTPPASTPQKPQTTVAPHKPQPVTSTSSYKSKAAEAKSANFVFGKVNYMIMIGGVLLIALGFILMIGGGSDDPKVFNYDLFDAQRLTFSTIFILLGFVVEVFAIMKKPKAKSA